MMQTPGRHDGAGPTAQSAPVAEFGHFDLDVAMEHVRGLRVDHFRWMAAQITECTRYVRSSLMRRVLFFANGRSGRSGSVTP